MNITSGLTPDEEEVMGLLVKAWQLYRSNIVLNQDEMQRFIHGLREIQQIFADRALYRAYPEYWSGDESWLIKVEP